MGYFSPEFRNTGEQASIGDSFADSFHGGHGGHGGRGYATHVYGGGSLATYPYASDPSFAAPPTTEFNSMTYKNNPEYR